MDSKILCIGEALIDMICTDKGRSLSEGEHFLKKPGGAPTNVAAAIAALGGRVALAAKVGRDPFGKHLADVMASFGVDTGWMLEDPEAFTTFAFVSLMENGERDFYFNRGADGRLTAIETEGMDISDVSILHFGSATAFLPGPLQEAYRGLFERAARDGKFISFDPNYRHLLYHDRQPSFIGQSLDFIERCHFFKLSDEEAMLISGASSVQESVERLRQRTNAVFAVTLGAEGTLLACADGNSVVPSIPVVPVDTTGAGDAFVGAVLYQLQAYHAEDMHRLPASEWAAIVAQANKAGARTCEYMGAMEAFRHLNTTIFK
jgi:fructokinase